VGLSMAERKAVTRQLADRYRKAPKKQKKLILDELCALTGWHRDHARRALRAVWLAPKGTLRRRGSPARRLRAQVYDERVIGIVRMAWAILDGLREMPCSAWSSARVRQCRGEPETVAHE